MTYSGSSKQKGRYNIVKLRTWNRAALNCGGEVRIGYRHKSVERQEKLVIVSTRAGCENYKRPNASRTVVLLVQLSLLLNSWRKERGSLVSRSDQQQLIEY